MNYKWVGDKIGKALCLFEIDTSQLNYFISQRSNTYPHNGIWIRNAW